MTGSNNSYTSAAEIRLDIFKRISEIISAMAAPARLLIIQLLAQRPRSVEDLANRANLSVANTSQHLQKLTQAGFLRLKKSGRVHTYELAEKEVHLAWTEIQKLAHQLDPRLDIKLDELFSGLPKAEVTKSELEDKVKRKAILLLDVRNTDETEHSPIPGAKCIERKALEKSLQKLPKKKPIYVVCRGRYCPDAKEAVGLLNQRGYQAFRVNIDPVTLQKYKR